MRNNHVNNNTHTGKDVTVCKKTQFYSTLPTTTSDAGCTDFELCEGMDKGDTKDTDVRGDATELGQERGCNYKTCKEAYEAGESNGWYVV